MKIKKKKIDLQLIDNIKIKLRGLNINTICTEARCPNISECASKNHATFLILGKICTRRCNFCNVTKGLPEKVDMSEPERIAEAVDRLQLSYVVITSPTRDDLSDGGAELYLKTIEAIKGLSIKPKIELLIPDFNGSFNSLQKLMSAPVHVLGHNMETVQSNYKNRAGADYVRSLEVLRNMKTIDPNIKTKSSFMLGMGETKQEVYKLMRDLIEANCDYLSIGQYLAPSNKHLPVLEQISPALFKIYREKALQLGFSYVKSGRYVRSSYEAELYSEKL